jgi:REP element-mobilizing transposase RayT
MGINSGIFLFVLVILGILAIFAGFLWLLYWLIGKFGKWLSRRNFFVELRQRRQGRRKVISTKRKLSMREFLAEVFTEPVILTVAIVISYNHLKAIWDTSPDFATFWLRINETTRSNVLVLVFLIVALILWMTVVTSRHMREEERDKAFEELQQTNTDKMVGAIEKLTAEIRASNKDKHGKSRTEM